MRGPLTDPQTPRNPLTLAERVSREFLVHHRLCPLAWGPSGELRVATGADALHGGLDDLSIAYRRPVVAEPVSADVLDALIAHLTGGDPGEGRGPTDPDLDALSTVAADDEPFVSDIRDLANQPPVVRYVNLLFRDAAAAGASDIHLEATRAGVAARVRLDGVLQPAPAPPEGMDRAVVSRIKLLADLDIAERRRPQDGRIRVRLAQGTLDLRVSTVPTVFGESVVLRLLDRGGSRTQAPITLDNLGLSPSLHKTMQILARRPHGMVLVTGPTGSGKTTTLYAALGLRNAAVEKILTLEDPVEYTLEGIPQVPVHPATGVTFAAMLRSLLRQDPDVLLVGEMRDTETAELAIQASLTGHVVFSTLHTNDATGAIPRLLDLGVPPYLVAATLDAVLAQRLVRRVCAACRATYEPPRELVALIRPPDDATPAPTFTRGAGCDACRGTGYRGRTGLFELLEIDDPIRESLAMHPSRQTLTTLALAAGMRPLRYDGWDKVLAGLTTIEEVLRVTQG